MEDSLGCPKTRSGKFKDLYNVFFADNIGKVPILKFFLRFVPRLARWVLLLDVTRKGA